MYYHAQRAYDLLYSVAEDAYPGAIIESSILTPDNTETIAAFAIANGGALTLVMCDHTNIPDDQWSFQISSGLVIDSQNVSGALLWANSSNRRTSLGKYYCAIGRDNRHLAVVYENFIWAGLFNLVFDGPHGPGTFKTLGDWIRFTLYNNVQAAAENTAELMQSIGGKYFTADEQGLMTLLQIASG